MLPHKRLSLTLSVPTRQPGLGCERTRRRLGLSSSSHGFAFCSSAPVCYLHLLVPDLATLSAAVMPGKDTASGCIAGGGYKPFGSVGVLPNPTVAVAESKLCCLPEDALCVVVTGSFAPAGAPVQIPRPLTLSCAGCENFSVAVPAGSDSPAGASVSRVPLLHLSQCGFSLIADSSTAHRHQRRSRLCGRCGSMGTVCVRRSG